MSFRSQLSGRVYPKGIKPVRIVTATRPRTYVNEYGEVSHGTEIVQEIAVGPDEAHQFNSNTPTYSEESK